MTWSQSFPTSLDPASHVSVIRKGHAGCMSSLSTSLSSNVLAVLVKVMQDTHTFFRYNSSSTREWDGRAGLPLCGFKGANGEGHSGQQIYRGRPVQWESVRDQHPVCPGSGWKGQWLPSVNMPEDLSSCFILKYFPCGNYCVQWKCDMGWKGSFNPLVGKTLYPGCVWERHKATAANTALSNRHFHQAKICGGPNVSLRFCKLCIRHRSEVWCHAYHVRWFSLLFFFFFFVKRMLNLKVIYLC